MHAMGKPVTQISMNARAVVGVNEVCCLGVLGQLLIGCVSVYFKNLFLVLQQTI